jgi:hypothetical protein
MIGAGRICVAAALALAVTVTAPVALGQTQAPPLATPTDAAAATPPPPAAVPSVVEPAPTSPLATAPAAAPTSTDEAAKIAELFAQDSATAAAEPSLKFYGFADFNVTRWLNLTDKWKNQFPDTLSFYVGKLNLYMEGNIASDWKSLIEVRYMFIPNGSGQPHGSASNGPSPNGSYLDPLSNSGRFNGVTGDYTEIGRPVDWNGINIQRAYLEHNFTNFLSVRVGRFLTPWGIWNVDHGSPVIIGTAKPYVIGEAFFPEAQTGFDAFGSIPLGDATLGYHVTLSNGRGPTEAFQDLDGNKGLGGRLSLKMYLLGTVDVGVSGYGGTVTDRRQEVNLQDQSLVYFTYEHYRELSWAADLRWIWKGLHFQTEGALHDRVWNNDARPVAFAGVQPDTRRLGLYALLGYRLPWLNLMPYAMYSYYDTGSRSNFGGTASRANVWSGGLNVRINPSVVFKIEYQRATFRNVVPGAMFGDPLEQLSSQLAWAF